MKNTNPLYLVKNNTVHPTQSLWDYVAIKFNLRPIIEVLSKILEFVLSQVKDYPSFVFAKNMINEITEKIIYLKGLVGA